MNSYRFDRGAMKTGCDAACLRVTMTRDGDDDLSRICSYFQSLVLPVVVECLVRPSRRPLHLRPFCLILLFDGSSEF